MHTTAATYRHHRITRLAQVVAMVMVGLAVVALVLAGTAKPAGAAPGAHQFVAVNPAGQPLKWDGNRSIRYVLNTGGADSRRAEVNRALTMVSQATGLTLEYAGDTGFVPTNRQPMPAAVWNATDRNTSYDVVIAFAGAGQTDLVGGGRSGMVVQRWSTEFLHAAVVIDTGLQPGWGVGRQSTVLLHELGHLMGLAHVNDPGALMYPTDGQAAVFTDGDWEGLRRVGNGRGLAYDPNRYAATATPAPARPAPAPATSVPAAAPAATPAPPAPPATPAPVPTTPIASVPAPAVAAPAAENRAASTNTTVPGAPTIAGDDADAFEALLARA